VVDLSRNAFKGWLNKWVGPLAELQRLTLSHNRLVGSLPDALGRLHKLEYFHIDHNRFDGDILPSVFLGMSPRMREIHLHENQFFTDVGGGGASSATKNRASKASLHGGVEEEGGGEEEDSRAEKLKNAKRELEGLFDFCVVLA